MGLKYVRKAPFPPGWAEDDTYDSGSDDWSDQPTKEIPSAGLIAKGFLPDEQVDAPKANLALYGTGSIGPLVHALMRQWQPYLVATDDSDNGTDYQIGGYQDDLAVVKAP